MTQDIFNPPFGTLDFIIYAVMQRVNITPLRLNTFTESLTPDEIAESNARALLNYFEGRKIHAIKEIREVSGLDLRSAKDAYDQIVETYALRDVAYYLNEARAANIRGEQGNVAFFLIEAERALENQG